MLGRLCNFASACSIIIAKNKANCRIADDTDARFRPSKSLALSGVSFSRLPDNAGISSDPSHHRFHNPEIADNLPCVSVSGGIQRHRGGSLSVGLVDCGDMRLWGLW